MRSRTLLRMMLIAVVSAVLVSTVLAQKTSNTGPKYDLSQEVKITGVIDEVRDVPDAGTQLVVKTETKTVLVRVAPTDFLKEIETTFNKGDQVQVLGAKNAGAAEEEILAREITVGVNTFTLRDDKGIPVWAGWKAPKSR